MVVTINWEVHEYTFSDARSVLYLDLCGGHKMHLYATIQQSVHLKFVYHMESVS